MPIKLDRYDVLLLAAVQEDARIAQRALGERVNLSTAAVNRRLHMLTQAGVIERTTAQINPKAVGYPLTVVIEVEMENDRTDLLDAMQRQLTACSQVQQCYYVTGECDFVLVMVVRDMEQYVELTRQFFHSDNNVKAFKTLVVMDRIKTGVGVPIDTGAPGGCGERNSV